MNTRKTIEECAKSAYEMAEFLDDSQQVKVENANFKSGVENIISGGAKVLDGVYGIIPTFVIGKTDGICYKLA